MTWLMLVRGLLIAEIVLQPIVIVWLMMIAGRIRRDQLAIDRFVKTWADRINADTSVPHTVLLSDVQRTLAQVQGMLNAWAETWGQPPETVKAKLLEMLGK